MYSFYLRIPIYWWRIFSFKPHAWPYPSSRLTFILLYMRLCFIHLRNCFPDPIVLVHSILRLERKGNSLPWHWFITSSGYREISCSRHLKWLTREVSRPEALRPLLEHVLRGRMFGGVLSAFSYMLNRSESKKQGHEDVVHQHVYRLRCWNTWLSSPFGRFLIVSYIHWHT